MSALASLIILTIVLGAIIGLCFLELRLARKPHWAPGLILPVANFLLTIVIIVCFVLYSATGMIHTGGTVSFLSDNELYKVTVWDNGTVDAVDAVTGEAIELVAVDDGLYNAADGTLVVTDEAVGETLEGFDQPAFGKENADGSVFTVAVPFLLFFLNLPTIGYLVIYFLTRRGVKNSVQLGKMEIQDM